MRKVRFSYYMTNPLTGGFSLYDSHKNLLPEFALMVEDGEGRLSPFDKGRAVAKIAEACSSVKGKVARMVEIASGSLLSGISLERGAGLLSLEGKVSREELDEIAGEGRVISNCEMRSRIALSLLRTDVDAWRNYLEMLKP